MERERERARDKESKIIKKKNTNRPFLGIFSRGAKTNFSKKFGGLHLCYLQAK